VNPETTPPHWSEPRWAAVLAALSAAVLAIHGYHPLAEDGGLYVAGVKWLLRPALFPHDTAFVREHLRFSVFGPTIASLVRSTGRSVLWVLFVCYLGTAALTLQAGRMILQRCGFADRAQLGGIALLACWWTMPVAGTSLMLMDPYITARSFSTPLTLLALAWAMDRWRWQPAVLCVAALSGAAAFHPLMAVYGAAFVMTLRAGRGRKPALHCVFLAVGVLALATVVQWSGAPESAAYVLAVHSRYYWFLAQWQWFEVMGLLGPFVILGVLRWWAGSRERPTLARLTEAVMAVAALSFAVALLFAQERYATHGVARLQPLRCFLEAYAIMALLLGSWLFQALTKPLRPKWQSALAAAIIAVNAAGFFAVARATFPASPQVEWPWAEERNRNPWVAAFLWARVNTPNDALFALDAKYINTDGEDAQTFRAIAERSALPDFSKDGGEAAITPSLAGLWLRGAQAQAGLSTLNDTQRDARLLPLGVTWMVLHADAPTTHPCRYANAAVKVCQLPR
jgi:hypothetical protein